MTREEPDTHTPFVINPLASDLALHDAIDERIGQGKALVLVMTGTGQIEETEFELIGQANRENYYWVLSRLFDEIEALSQALWDRRVKADREKSAGKKREESDG